MILGKKKKVLNIYYIVGGSVDKETTCNAGDLGWEDPLKKEMATYSSILAWEISWTKKPSRLQSMGCKSQK